MQFVTYNNQIFLKHTVVSVRVEVTQYVGLNNKIKFKITVKANFEGFNLCQESCNWSLFTTPGIVDEMDGPQLA